MAAEFELNAETRADLGKGASRRLRLHADLVPAIIYGAGKDPQSLSIPHKDLMKATENEAFFSHILTINVGGEKQSAIIKDLQRHPSKVKVRYNIHLHATLQRQGTVQHTPTCSPPKTRYGITYTYMLPSKDKVRYNTHLHGQGAYLCIGNPDTAVHWKIKPSAIRQFSNKILNYISSIGLIFHSTSAGNKAI